MSYDFRKYCNGNLYAGIVKHVKSTTIYRPICTYYNGCKKTTNYLQDLYACIAYLKRPYGS